MFKSVEYVGFEGRPELAAKARHANDVLAGEVGDRRGEVEVRWELPAGTPTGCLELSLSRALDNGVSATYATTVYARDFADEQDLAWRCRRAWSSLLGMLLDQQHRRVMEYLD